MIREDDKDLHKMLTSFLEAANSVDDVAYDSARVRLVQFINGRMREEVDKANSPAVFFNGLINGIVVGAAIAAFTIVALYM